MAAHMPPAVCKEYVVFRLSLCANDDTTGAAEAIAQARYYIAVIGRTSWCPYEIQPEPDRKEKEVTVRGLRASVPRHT